MNVLYIGGFKLPDKNAAAHRVLANSKILKELGFNVFLIGQDETIEDKNLVVIDSDLENIFMFSNAYPKNSVEWFKYIIDVHKIKSYIELYKIDHVILYNYPAFSTLRLLSFFRKNKIKVFADCTEWYGFPDGNILKKIIKKLDTSLRMRFINKKLSGVICISKYLVDFYKNSNTILLPPLVDCSEKKWQAKSDRYDKTIMKFIYAGQMGTKDRINNLLKILSSIPNKNFKFEIVGTDKENFFKNNVVEYNLDEFVEFYGRLSHVKTLSKVASSDFVVFLRDNNRINNAGFPTKFVEALTCGTPVITNGTSNISDYLVDGHNGFVLPENENEIRDKFLKIINLNRETIFNLKQNCDIQIFDYKLYIKEFRNFMKV